MPWLLGDPRAHQVRATACRAGDRAAAPDFCVPLTVHPDFRRASQFDRQMRMMASEQTISLRCCSRGWVAKRRLATKEVQNIVGPCMASGARGPGKDSWGINARSSPNGHMRIRSMCRAACSRYTNDSAAAPDALRACHAGACACHVAQSPRVGADRCQLRESMDFFAPLWLKLQSGRHQGWSRGGARERRRQLGPRPPRTLSPAMLRVFRPARAALKRTASLRTSKSSVWQENRLGRPGRSGVHFTRSSWDLNAALYCVRQLAGSHRLKANRLQEARTCHYWIHAHTQSSSAPTYGCCAVDRQSALLYTSLSGASATQSCD